MGKKNVLKTTPNQREFLNLKARNTTFKRKIENWKT